MTRMRGIHAGAEHKSRSGNIAAADANGAWVAIGPGSWVRGQDTIRKVSPRGAVLYALRLEGSKRPSWHDTLAEAKREAG